MKEQRTIYYRDELNDEFSSAKIVPRTIDENYRYVHGNVFYRFFPLFYIASSQSLLPFCF